MSFVDHWEAHFRLTILRVLAEAPSGSANDSLLKSACGSLGLAATRDQVRTELAWLQEQRLVSTNSAGELMVATITERGQDVAGGAAVVPGVQRPTPRP